MKHGYNLTPLGCLLNSPWEYDLINDSLYNIQILRINIEISSKGYRYTPNQAQLVFQLQRDMSLRYWVKNDYINSPSDTSLDGAIMKHGVTIDNNNIRNIYMGRWTVNFDDSTLKFIFDDGKFSFPGIEGKYVELGSTSMNLQKVVFFDSTIAGKNVNLKKVITTYLTH